MGTPPRVALAALSLACLAGPARAGADHGVSDERLALPDGPGSIGGIGQNIAFNPNMGLMSYAVSIDLPQGIATATPSLALRYGSGAGASIAGLGWSLEAGFIERMTSRGLPRYDEEDEIAADGGTELVRVGQLDGSAVYRARFEGAMVRYRWHARGSGQAGYWTAERPDGSVDYYGADETGAAVTTARVTHPSGGVFRYCLVASVDTHGNVIRYRYRISGELPLLIEVGYAYGRGASPRFSVQIAYEPREDVISTGAPGFLLETRERLSEVRVRSGSEIIRSYRLEYEPMSASGGLSRLSRVRRFGQSGVEHPATQTFEYSRSLAGVCDGGCSGPFVVDMGTLPGGVDLQSGRATLIDIDGDALPDVLSTSPSGEHTFAIARIDPSTGEPRFESTPVHSRATVGGSEFVLSSPSVQVIDVDGDGHTDIVSGRTGRVLCNEGTGDWSFSACLMDATLPVLDEDAPGDPNPRFVRFFDYDNDRRIDLIRTLDASAEVYVNTPAGFVGRTVEPIGQRFDVSTLQLADMNGDGLQDPVEVQTGGRVRFRLNLGFARWSDWVEADVPGLSDADVALAELEDLDGDGLADVVVVSGQEMRIARNRSAGAFEPIRRITSTDVAGELPERTPTTTVLFADMNGSGSRDVVWITSSGRMRYLELFAVRPNLLSRIENGIGGVQEIEYGTSVVQRAVDEVAWSHPLPHAMNVVVAMDVWERLTGGPDGSGLHERTEVRYRDGFYDGVDRAFRGFAFVEQRSVSESSLDSQEEGTTLLEFDVGAVDPYRHGLALRSRLLGGPERRALRETRTEYRDCPLSGVPASGLRLPVRYVCAARETTIEQEGRPEREWAATRTERTYDGYGEVTRLADHGLVHFGPPEAPSPCPPCGGGGVCGDACLGDEQIEERDLVEPGAATSGRWILGRTSRVRRSGEASGLATEEVTRYDGEPFVGLPEGRLTNGAPTAVLARVSADRFVARQRVRRDELGNVVEEIDPNGATDEATTRRRVLTYDPLGLRVIRVEILTHDPDGLPYRLRRDIAHEASFLEPSEATSWMVVRDGSPVTPRDPTQYVYDEHGRTRAIVSPGDDESAPTVVMDYELASPVSRVRVRRRSEIGGPLDIERAECIDGIGRTVQTRTRLDASSVEVTGFALRNRRGLEVRAYQPHRSASMECDTAPPSGVPFTALRYDAAGRPIERTEPDADLYGSASIARIEYEPLARAQYDEEAGEGGRHAGTPTVFRLDGLGRVHAIDRLLTARGEGGRYELRYDALGRLAGVLDPQGNLHSQEYDLLGRVVAVDDPNGGRTTLRYDDADNLIERTDARGRIARTEYDGANRPIAVWDPSDEDGTRIETVYDIDPACGECRRGAGRAVSSTYPLADLGVGRDEASYDPRGRLVTRRRTIAGQRFEWAYSYDDADRPVAVVEPDGTHLAQTLDAASRVVAVDGVLDAIRYDERAQLGAIEHANGARTTYAYDTRQRLTELRTFGRGNDLLQGFRYTRDRAGRIRSIADLGAGAPERPSASAELDYDAWHRLTRAEYEGERLDFTYDLLDNVLAAESSLGAASRGHVGAMRYDAARPNAVSSAGSITFGYDEAGNVALRGSRRYRWDHLGRLEQVATPDGVTGRFYYGGDAGRIAKREGASLTLYLDPSFEVRDGIAQTYVRVEGRRVARIRSAALQARLYSDVAPFGAPDGRIEAADAWIAHASSRGIVGAVGPTSAPEALLMAAARRQLLDAGDRVTALHHDHLGSLTLSTDERGARRGERLFYPFGQPRWRDGFVDEAAFTGQELDESTALYAFRFRQLDSVTGRWASVDPAFAVLTPELVGRLGEATSAYAYVANDPVDRIDPLGLGSVSSTAKASGAHGQQRAQARQAHRQRSNAFRRFRQAQRERLRGHGGDGGGTSVDEVRSAVNFAVNLAHDPVGTMAHELRTTIADRAERAVTARAEHIADSMGARLDIDVRQVRHRVEAATSALHHASQVVLRVKVVLVSAAIVASGGIGAVPVLVISSISAMEHARATSRSASRACRGCF